MSSTPGSPRGKSSGGWRLSAPRELHPRVGLTRPPPLPETALRWPPATYCRLWLDGSIIVPIAGRRCGGCRPSLITAGDRFLRGVQVIGQITLVCGTSLTHWQIMAQQIKWLLFITLAKGMYLMNVYSVVTAAPWRTSRGRRDNLASGIIVER